MSEKVTPEVILEMYRTGMFYYTTKTGITEDDLSRDPKPMVPIDDLVIIPSKPGTNLTVKDLTSYRSIIVSVEPVDVLSKKYFVAIYSEQDRNASSFNFYVIMLNTKYLVMDLKKFGPDSMTTVGEKTELIRDIPNHEMYIYEPCSNGLYLRQKVKLGIEENKIFLYIDENQQLRVGNEKIDSTMSIH